MWVQVASKCFGFNNLTKELGSQTGRGRASKWEGYSQDGEQACFLLCRP
jgi:hypothetical protein